MSRRSNGKKADSARQVALEVLLQWEKEGGPVDLLVTEFSPGLPDPRDHYLVKTLVYGVLQNRTLLDYILRQFSRLPLNRLKKIVLLCLRLGLYQLLFLDRIPAPIAVHETVAVLKQRSQPKQLTGMVNAILRNVLRRQEGGDWQPLRIDDLQVRWSHPEWLVARWRLRYGDRMTARICQSDNRPPPLVLRVNTRKIDRERYLDLLHHAGITGKKGDFSPDAVYVIDHRGSPEKLPGYSEGFFQVQDEGAQLISYLLGPMTAGSYLDCCAGLGGKTGHLAQMLPSGAKLVAIEPHRERQSLFIENAKRLDISGIELFRGSLQEFCEKERGERQFTGILLDAPCSGLGVIRRHPEIRWNRKPEDLATYCRQQQGLLFLAAGLLQPGGVLVYATCSTEPEENEEVVRGLLSGLPELIQENCLARLPETAKPLVNKQGYFQTMPGQGELDGFFAAVFRKEMFSSTAERSR